MPVAGDGRRRRAAGADEALEEAVDLVVGDPDAGVDHLEHGLLGVAAQAHGQVALRGRELDASAG
jgi:hypothetical protein